MVSPATSSTVALPGPERRHRGGRSSRRRRARSSGRRDASRPPPPRARRAYSRRRPGTDLPRAVHLVAEAPRPGRRAARRDRWPRGDRRPPSRLGRLQYATGRRAASAPRVPRLTASIGSTPARRVQSTNSSVPTMLGSIVRQARSNRGRPRRRGGRCRPPSRSRRRSCRPDSGRSSRPSSRTSASDVVTPAVGVGGGVPGLVDAAVDGATHVLDEDAEDPLVDDPDRRRRRVDRSSGHQPSVGLGQVVVPLDELDGRADERSAVALSGRSTEDVPTATLMRPGLDDAPVGRRRCRRTARSRGGT